MEQTRTSGLRCDCLYFKSPSGVLKIIQMLSSLISFICTEHFDIEDQPGITGWFRTATATGSIVSLIFLILYLIHFLEKFDRLRCLIMDLVICVLCMIFNLTVFWTNNSVRAKDYVSTSAAITATSIFTFISMVAYGCDAVLKLVRIITSQPVQD